MTPASTSTLDIDVDSRLALEFDDLLDWIASYTRTPSGRRRVLATTPVVETGVVRDELEAVEQTRQHLAEAGRLVAERLPDADGMLQSLAVGGLGIDAQSLRRGARVLAAASRLGRSLRALDEERFSHLARLGRGMPDLSGVCRAVLEGTDGEGRILDGASAELRRVRRSLARVSEQLRALLQRVLHQPGAEAVVRDDFVTQRNGRFVIPVRTDAPRSIRGIVHASSSSGATRFVEPLESVDQNNELVRLAEQERIEEERVLAAWSDAFRQNREQAGLAVDRLARADELQARALFAEQARCVSPQVAPGGTLRFCSVRHPLLDRRLAEQDAECVPATIALDPADRVLVISGPNTGGKTVILKTLGLSVLMAQSGIPIPALQAELPMFRQIRADIGDHQSIEADLSTYSAHVGAIVGFLRDRITPSLFLFDELGTGTEPAEGASLAQAILEDLACPGVTAVATTHHGALKRWAVTSEQAVCAAMEFDEVSLRPTYRIRIGTAGVSAGLQIAERLGLPESIVERAREGLDPQARQSEAYLSRLHAALSEAEGARERLRSREEELEQARQRFESGIDRETEERLRRVEQETERLLERFRRAARRELEALGQQGAAADRRLRRGEQRLSRERGQLRAALGGKRQEQPPEDWEAPGTLETGMTVHVRSLGRQGVVGEVFGEQVEVRLGHLSLRVPRADLRISPTSPPATPTTEVRTSASARGGAPRELMLVGQRVEDGLRLLDRFLDAAHMAEHGEVRVIHGHGSGRLRAAVRRHLDEHPLVMGHRPGGQAEGGEGATVATLA